MAQTNESRTSTNMNLQNECEDARSATENSQTHYSLGFLVDTSNRIKHTFSRVILEERPREAKANERLGRQGILMLPSATMFQRQTLWYGLISNVAEKRRFYAEKRGLSIIGSCYPMEGTHWIQTTLMLMSHSTSRENG